MNHLVGIDLEDDELDMLRRLDGPPPLEVVQISRGIQELARCAVREIRRRRAVDDNLGRHVVLYDMNGAELARTLWRGEMNVTFAIAADGHAMCWDVTTWELVNHGMGPRRGGTLDRTQYCAAGDTLTLNAFGLYVPYPEPVKIPPT